MELKWQDRPTQDGVYWYWGNHYSPIPNFWSSSPGIAPNRLMCVEIKTEDGEYTLHEFGTDDTGYRAGPGRYYGPLPPPVPPGGSGEAEGRTRA